MENATIEFAMKKELIGEAAEPSHFYVVDGAKLTNLKDLANHLETMHEDTFRFHANETRNDFANWAKDVFEEHELADALSKAESKSAAQVTVLKHIVNKI